MAGDPRVADLVQAGKIRVAVFLPQYSKDPKNGALRGIGMGFVAIEMGRALAARLAALRLQPSEIATGLATCDLSVAVSGAADAQIRDEIARVGSDLGRGLA